MPRFSDELHLGLNQEHLDSWDAARDSLVVVVLIFIITSETETKTKGTMCLTCREREGQHGNPIISGWEVKELFCIKKKLEWGLQQHIRVVENNAIEFVVVSWSIICSDI